MTRLTRCLLLDVLLCLSGCLLLGGLLWLGGCSDAAYWHQRTFYGIDCRPEKLLPNGQCAPITKGATHAQTLHP
jgi:hypothetical protein